MLNPEYAKEQLQTFYVSDWHETRVAKAAILPQALKEIVFGILERDNCGQFFIEYYVRYEAQ